MRVLLWAVVLGCGSAKPPAEAAEPKTPAAAVPAVAVPSADGCPDAPKTTLGTWTSLGSGVEHAWFAFDPPPPVGCNRLDVVRIDPAKVQFVAYTEHLHGKGQKTAKEWCDPNLGYVVTNLGMYHPDGRHVGYLAVDGQVDQATVVGDYRSVFLAGPKSDEQPGATIADFGGDSLEGPTKDWNIVSQNLRLIADPGKNVWSKQERRWSEAALGRDGSGRILILHTRAAFTMAELNDRLLAMSLDLRQAMHLEGGPEASLSICTPSFQLHASGGFESGFSTDEERVQWPLPNVLAIAAK